MAIEQQMNDYRSRFEDDGFFIVRSLFGDAEMTAIGERLDMAAQGRLSERVHIQVEPELQGKETSGEPLGRVRKVAKLALNDGVFTAFVSQPKITSLMRALLGQNLRYLGDEAQLKPARYGSAHPWHQDAPYFHAQVVPFATMWIAIDEATVANGCLEVLPGAHKCGVIPRRQRRAWFEEGELDTSDAVSVCLAAGDALVFHSLLPHGSGPNQTPHRRRSMICRYVNIDDMTGEQFDVFGRLKTLSDAPDVHEIFRNDIGAKMA